MFIFICINLMFVYKYINKINLTMSKIPNFEKFNEAIVPVGFGQMGINNFALGGATPQTGYSMTPIAGPVQTCSENIASEACSYHENDNPDHTAEAYIKEAKKYLNEAIDKAHESYSATNEAMVQIAGKDKPSGAKVLAMVIVDHLIDKKIVTRAYKKKLESEIQDIIINSTF